MTVVDQTFEEQASEKRSFLEQPVFATLIVNWELALYSIIFVVAVATRFYDLGARVMSHDESLHALFSFKLYDGDGYNHDPLMHGPLQFHLVALSYLLFGDNDFTARIPAALFGIALVILPYWFRPWLGRIGALVTSVGLLISPSLLYYQRYIRNEAFILFLTALMALALFQFMRTRQTRWLYWGSAAVALSIASKEVALIHGFIGVLFIGGAFLWERLSPRHFRNVQWGLLAGSFLLLLITLAMQFLDPQQAAEAAGEAATSFDVRRTAGFLQMIFGLLLALWTISLNVDRQMKPMTAAIMSFAGRLEILIGPVILAVAIFVLLHTTFFTNPNGLVSGSWGAVTYWLGQQEVERGSQPGFYYMMLMPLYEFLPLFVGGIGGLIYLIKGAPSHIDPLDAEVIDATGPKSKKKQNADTEAPAIDNRRFASDRGTFAAYLIVWAIGSFVIYSWAGEKMPWLTTHIALPFIFLMGHVTQTAVGNFNWSVLKQRSGIIFTILIPVLIAAILALISLNPFQGQELDQLRQTTQFVVVLLAVGGLAYGVWTYGRSLTVTQIKGILFTLAVSIMTILTIRFAWLSNYVNYDYVNEFIVYAHGAPDVKWMLDEIDDISRRTVGDKQIKVAYGGVIWPLEWYMREYPNRAFFGSNPNRDALDAPVVIISPDPDVTLSDVEPYLGQNYHRFDYRQVWWPVEDYKTLSWQSFWTNYVSPNPNVEGGLPDQVSRNWESLWNIIFYRQNINHTLSEWPFRTQMHFYVRKDVLNELWDYRTGPLSLAELPTDPYEGLTQDLPSILSWGSEGTAEGQFISPRAITVSPQGQVYVADSGNERIQVFDQNGGLLKTWGTFSWTSDNGLKGPWGIAVSEDGRVYIADTWNNRILIYDEDGNYISEFGPTFTGAVVEPAFFFGPRGIALDGKGNVYVSDTGNKRILQFTTDGELITAWGGGGVVPGRFEEPVGLAIDSVGNIYVADTWNQRIQKFDANFVPITEWPVVGWDSEDILNKPYLTVDSQDRVYVSDPENYRIIVYSPDGEVLTTFGQFGADSQSFNTPLGVATGEDNTLFVLDSENHRIMKFAIPE